MDRTIRLNNFEHTYLDLLRSLRQKTILKHMYKFKKYIYMYILYNRYIIYVYFNRVKQQKFDIIYVYFNRVKQQKIWDTIVENITWAIWKTHTYSVLAS